MTQYIVNLTEAENLAMSYEVLDQQEWIDNLVHERCRIAAENIISIAVNKCLELGIQVPGTKDAIVELAFEKGWVKSLADQLADLTTNSPQAS